MSAARIQKHVEVDGVTVAGVTVQDSGTEVSIRMFVVGGHVPSSARRRLMDTTFDLPILHRPRPVHAAVPLGDHELITGLSRHLDHMQTRAAGATCLVDGIVAAEPS